MFDIKTLWKKVRYYPEPVTACFFFGIMMLSPVQEQYLYKVYSGKLGIDYDPNDSKSSCPAINSTNNNTALMHQIQNEVSKFVTRQTFAVTLPPIIGVLYFGPVSDRIGRKPFLILCMVGFLVNVLTLVLIDICDIDILFLHFGGLVNGLCGYLPCMLFVLSAYLSDISPGERLPFRIAIIDAITFSSLGISNMLSGIVLESFGFLGTFLFITGFVIISIFLSIFQLKESLASEVRANKTSHWIQSPKRIFKVLMAPRSQKWRMRLLIPIDSLGGFFTQVVIAPILMLRLLNFPFCWNPVEIGMLRGSYFFISGIGAVFAVKLIPLYFNKMFVVFLSYLSTCGYLLVIGIFETKTMYYVAVVIGMFSYCALAMTRALLSLCVKKDEKGALFSFLAALNSVVSITATYIFQGLYRLADKHDKPGDVFIAISFMTVPPFILALLYLLKDKRNERREKQRKQSNVSGKEEPLGSTAETDPLLA